MTPKQEAQAQDLINRHIQMSGQTLDALRAAGLKDDQQVQLDFFFKAPDEGAAKALLNHLRANDCLDLKIERTGGILSRKYSVTGRTHPTPVTTEVLAQWIPWIVVQGIVRNCEFDGWGAQA